MPLAHKSAVNAFVREALANGVGGIAEGHAVSPDPVCVGTKPGPQGGASGRPDRLAVIGALETDSLRRNAVEVRGPQSGFGIAIQHVIAHGFTQNHDRLAGVRLVRAAHCGSRLFGDGADACCASQFNEISAIHGMQTSGMTVTGPWLLERYRSLFEGGEIRQDRIETTADVGMRGFTVPFGYHHAENVAENFTTHFGANGCTQHAEPALLGGIPFCTSGSPWHARARSGRIRRSVPACA